MAGAVIVPALISQSSSNQKTTFFFAQKKWLFEVIKWRVLFQADIELNEINE